MAPPIIRSQNVIVCQNPACRQVKHVLNRHLLRTQRFCSRRCAGIVVAAQGWVRRQAREARHQVSLGCDAVTTAGREPC